MIPTTFIGKTEKFKKIFFPQMPSFVGPDPVKIGPDRKIDPDRKIGPDRLDRPTDRKKPA